MGDSRRNSAANHYSREDIFPPLRYDGGPPRGHQQQHGASRSYTDQQNAALREIAPTPTPLQAASLAPPHQQQQRQRHQYQHQQQRQRAQQQYQSRQRQQQQHQRQQAQQSRQQHQHQPRHQYQPRQQHQQQQRQQQQQSRQQPRLQPRQQHLPRQQEQQQQQRQQQQWQQQQQSRQQPRQEHQHQPRQQEQRRMQHLQQHLERRMNSQLREEQTQQPHQQQPSTSFSNHPIERVAPADPKKASARDDRDNQSEAEARKRRKLDHNSCELCASSIDLKSRYRIVSCGSCRKVLREFIDSSNDNTNLSFDCVSGRNDCDLSKRPKEHGSRGPCRRCCIRNALALGAELPKLPIETRATRQAPAITNENFVKEKNPDSSHQAPAITIEEVVQEKSPEPSRQAPAITIEEVVQEKSPEPSRQAPAITNEEIVQEKSLDSSHQTTAITNEEVVQEKSPDTSTSQAPAPQQAESKSSLSPSPSSSSLVQIDLSLIQKNSSISPSTDKQNTIPAAQKASRRIICTVCSICSYSRSGVKRKYNVAICKDCRKFVEFYLSREIFSYECDTGRNACNISRKRRFSWQRPVCPGCRLRKAIDLGLKHPSLPESIRNESKQPSSNANTHQKKTTSELLSSEGRQAGPVISSPEAAGKACPVCNNPNHVQNRSAFGSVKLCANCKNFLLKTFDLNLTYTCLKSNTCTIQWVPDRTKKLCPACRFKRAAAVPGLKYDKHPTQAKKRSYLLNSNSQISIANSDSQPARPHMKHLLVHPKQQIQTHPGRLCGICKNPNYVKNRSALGIRCCMNCRAFLYNTLNSRPSLKCYNGEKCALRWVPNGFHRGFVLCRFCRWKKAAQIPGFKFCHLDQAIGPSSGLIIDRKWLPRTCCICKNPNRVHKSIRFGLQTCENCLRIMKINVRKNTTQKCPNEGKCDIRWRPGYAPACSLCRWAKIISHPQFKRGKRRGSGEVRVSARPTITISTTTLQVTVDSEYTFDSSLDDEHQTEFGHEVPSRAASPPVSTLNFVPLPPSPPTPPPTTPPPPAQASFGDPAKTSSIENNHEVCSVCENSNNVSTGTPFVENSSDEHKADEQIHILATNVIVAHKREPSVVEQIDQTLADDDHRPSQNQDSQLKTPPDRSPSPTAGETLPPEAAACATHEEEHDSEPTCCICKNHGELRQSSHGVVCCENCHQFISYSLSRDEPYKCPEDGRCDTTGQDGEKFCSACRWSEIIQHHDINYTDANTQPTGEGVERAQAQAQPVVQVRILTAEELDGGGVDEFDLPLNVEERYSRWFYGDLSCFQRAGKRPKRRRHEVEPRAPVHIITYSNSLDDRFALLTEDLDSEADFEPIQELCRPMLKLRPSIGLRKMRAEFDQVSSDSSDSSDSDSECYTEKESELSMTFRLQIHRTIIDRRPILEQQKDDTDEDSCDSEPLIGPGEDCDEDDDDGIVEIDCDS